MKFANLVAGIGGTCCILAIPIGWLVSLFGAKNALPVAEIVCVVGFFVSFGVSYFVLKLRP